MPLEDNILKDIIKQLERATLDIPSHFEHLVNKYFEQTVYGQQNLQVAFAKALITETLKVITTLYGKNSTAKTARVKLALLVCAILKLNFTDIHCDPTSDISVFSRLSQVEPSVARALLSGSRMSHYEQLLASSRAVQTPAQIQENYNAIMSLTATDIWNCQVTWCTELDDYKGAFYEEVRHII